MEQYPSHSPSCTSWRCLWAAQSRLQGWLGLLSRHKLSARGQPPKACVEGPRQGQPGFVLSIALRAAGTREWSRLSLPSAVALLWVCIYFHIGRRKRTHLCWQALPALQRGREKQGTGGPFPGMEGTRNCVSSR